MSVKVLTAELSKYSNLLDQTTSKSNVQPL